MNESELIKQAYEGSREASVVLGSLWAEHCSGKHLRHDGMVAVLGLLRGATAAAQELERRAAGAPRPKVG